MRDKLPEFERPPLEEVVLGTQFEKLHRLGAAQLGWIWHIFRDRFPKTSEHPPLDPVFERFGTPPFQVKHTCQETHALVPRLWFVAERETELIQVQQDRFIRNWRRVRPSDAYPRYSQLRAAFAEDFGQFTRCVKEEGWGEVEPNQCEVTYVNVIQAGEGWEHHDELDRICALFAGHQTDPLPNLGRLEQGALRVSYVLEHGNGCPVGRLYVSIDPVFTALEARPAFRLLLTARGAPLGGRHLPGVLAFFDLAHEAIVRLFAAITTQEMHRIWGRRY